MEALLEALETEDAETLVRAIEQCAGCLAADGPRHPDLDLVTRALVRRSEHPRAKVRQAVAEAAVHLPEETYEPLIARLLQDPNAFVKQAAVDTYDERSRRARTVHDCEELSAEILRLRTRIEDDYGKKVARLTDQLSNRVLSQFLDRFFHEIAKVTAPLRGAIADIRVEARATAPDRARIADRASEASEMAELLRGMIASARAQAQADDPTYREISVRKLVDEQLTLLKGRIGEPRLARLCVETEVDPALTIEADKVLLAQALGNLLQNAVEAYPAEGTAPIFVRIHATRRSAGALVALAVGDRGSGIAERLVAQVGEPFASSKGPGRGLGVLNVRRTIEVAHGGTLQIDSELGVGTEMTLVIPRKQRGR